MDKNRETPDKTRARDDVRQRQQIYRRWQEEAATCRAKYADFDIMEEVRSEAGERFLKLLESGVDVTTAYEVIHLEELKQRWLRTRPDRLYADLLFAFSSLAQRSFEAHCASDEAQEFVLHTSQAELRPQDRRQEIWQEFLAYFYFMGRHVLKKSGDSRLSAYISECVLRFRDEKLYGYVSNRVQGYADVDSGVFIPCNGPISGKLYQSSDSLLYHVTLPLYDSLFYLVQGSEAPPYVNSHHRTIGETFAVLSLAALFGVCYDRILPILKMYLNAVIIVPA